MIAGSVIWALEQYTNALTTCWSPDIAAKAKHAFSKDNDTQFVDAFEEFLDEVEKFSANPQRYVTSLRLSHLLITITATRQFPGLLH